MDMLVVQQLDPRSKTPGQQTAYTKGYFCMLSKDGPSHKRVPHLIKNWSGEATALIVD